MNESRNPIVENACAAADPSLDANDFIEVAPDHGSAAQDNLAKRDALHAQASDEENPASTLIEFPVAGKNTRNRPQWRKDLSERVREIQERRARDASRQDEAQFAQTPTARDSSAEKSLQKSTRTRRGELPTTQTGTKNSPPLNLVPPTEQPPPNPIVVAALRRVERARQNASMSHHYHGVMQGHVGTATARAYAPSAQTEAETERDTQLPFVAPDMETNLQMDTQTLAETTHATEKDNQTNAQTEKHSEPRVKLVTIPTRAVEPSSNSANTVAEAAALTTETVATETAVPTRSARTPRRVTSVVVDETFLTKLESEQYAVNTRSEHGVSASLSARLCAGVIDLACAGILTAPFAIVIAWLGDGWTTAELRASLLLVYAFVLFGYLTVAVALVGRTLGMKLFSLRTFDARTGLLPTVGRSAQRAVWHILSLACAGLGLLSALIDRDRRTVPDRLTQTRVLRVSK